MMKRNKTIVVMIGTIFMLLFFSVPVAMAACGGCNEEPSCGEGNVCCPHYECWEPTTPCDACRCEFHAGCTVCWQNGIGCKITHFECKTIEECYGDNPPEEEPPPTHTECLNCNCATVAGPGNDTCPNPPCRKPCMPSTNCMACGCGDGDRQ